MTHYKHRVTSRDVMKDIAHAIVRSEALNGRKIALGAAFNSAAREFGWKDWNTYLGCVPQTRNKEERENLRQHDLFMLLEEAAESFETVVGDRVSERFTYVGRRKDGAHEFREGQSGTSIALTLWPLHFHADVPTKELKARSAQDGLAAEWARRRKLAEAAAEEVARMRADLRQHLPWDGGDGARCTWNIGTIATWVSVALEDGDKNVEAMDWIMEEEGTSIEVVLHDALRMMELDAMRACIMATPSFASLVTRLREVRQKATPSLTAEVEDLMTKCEAEAPPWVRHEIDRYGLNRPGTIAAALASDIVADDRGFFNFETVTGQGPIVSRGRFNKFD